MSTYLELQNEVLEHQLNDTKYRPFVKQTLNEAQNDVARRIKLRSHFTPTSQAVSTETFVVPTDFLSVVEVSLGTNTEDWTRLQKMSLRDFDEAPAATGTPHSYLIVGELVYLYPAPASEETIVFNYYRLPAAMTDDTDEPEIAAQYHHLLPLYSLKRCFQRENDYEAANYWQQSYEEELARHMGESHGETYDGPDVQPGTWGDSPVSGWNQWR